MDFPDGGVVQSFISQGSLLLGVSHTFEGRGPPPKVAITMVTITTVTIIIVTIITVTIITVAIITFTITTVTINILNQEKARKKRHFLSLF